MKRKYQIQLSRSCIHYYTKNRYAYILFASVKGISDSATFMPKNNKLIQTCFYEETYLNFKLFITPVLNSIHSGVFIQLHYNQFSKNIFCGYKWCGSKSLLTLLKILNTFDKRRVYHTMGKNFKYSPRITSTFWSFKVYDIFLTYCTIV